MRRLARRSLVLAAPALALAAAACDRGSTKAELLKKAEKAKTKADLETMLGKPTDVEKLGPIEKWTYRASDGAVVFAIFADRIVVEATDSKKK